MKKMLVALAFLNTLFFMSTACSQDDSNYIQPKFEDLGAYTPDDISNWPHAIFSFNDWACTDMQMADNRLGIDPIVRNGSRTTVLAYSSKENIRFTTLRSGENPYDYILQIKDFDADIPQVWIQCSSLDQMAGPITLTPLTSTLKIRLIEAPDNMESLQIVLPGMNDALYLFSGVTEPADGIKNKTLRLTASDGDRTYYLFPMCSDRSWNLDFTISIDGSQYPGTLTIPHGIGAGEALEVDFDFSKMDSGSYNVSYRKAEYGSKPALLASNTFENARYDETFKNKNPYYNVYVLEGSTWKSVEVHNALCSNAPRLHEQIWNDWNNAKKLRDTMCYAQFLNDFAGPVRVRIEKRVPFSQVRVRPSTWDIATELVAANTIEFSLPSWEHRKVSVEFDGDRYHNLFLLPNRPDPAREQYADGSADRYFKNGVYYFGGGKEHILAENAPIKLTSGQTLYIDEGTTLYGRIEARGSNITITGRGTLSGAKLQHVGNQYASGNILIDVLNNNGSNNCSGFKINGITIVDTPSWCLRIFNTDDVTIDNINMIHWILNGDGIDICTGKRISITDCMLRTYDDCITLKVRHNAKPIGPIDDVKIERCQVWTELARGIVVGPECGDMTSLSYKTGGISNVSVSDCVVLEASRANDSNFENAGLGVMAESAGSNAPGVPGPIDNILFEDCVIDDIHSSGRPLSIMARAHRDGKCTVSNITFRNVRIISQNGCRISGIDPQGNIFRTLTFENCDYNGLKISSLDPSFLICTNMDNVTGLKFQ